MKTKIIKPIRLWLVFTAFLLASFQHGKADDISTLESRPVPVLGGNSVTEINGKVYFCSSIYISVYIRENGTMVYDRDYTIEPNYGETTGIKVDGDDNLYITTTSGCSDGKGGNTAPSRLKMDSNTGIYNPLPCPDVPANLTQGDYTIFQFGASTVICGTSGTTIGSGSTTTGTTTVSAANISTGTELVQTVIQGLWGSLGVTTGNPPLINTQIKLAKPAGIKANDVTSNDLSGIILYGTAQGGGTANDGVLYKINGDGTGYQILHNFGPGSANGEYPLGNVIFSSDGGTLYGTTSAGNPQFLGTIYSISTNGTGYTNLYTYPTVSANGGVFTYGMHPSGDLLLSGDTLYGVTGGGGANSNGVIYSVKTNGALYTVLYNFSALSTTTNAAGLYTNIDGADPVAGLILSSNVLIGTTTKGGTNGYGTLFGLVLGPPIITSQPASQTADFNDTVAFTVGLNGTPPFGFQWQHNGTNLTDVSATNNPYLVGGYTTSFNSSNQLGGYSVIVTNVYGAVTSSVATLSMDLVKDDSFYGFSFTGWTLTGISQSSVNLGDRPNAYGLFAAVLGENSNSLSYISQNLPTVAGQAYLLSFWLNTSKVSPPNEFLTSWNGSALLDQVNIPTGTNANDPVNSVPSTGWTNMQYTVVATGTNSLLQFGFQTGQSTNQFLLTEINLAPVTVALAPIPLNIQLSGNQVILNWTNPAFALQAAPVATGTYANVPNATNSPYTNPITGPQTFFRLIH
jgi:uncharacterized repeat protein (TIGR03803 family)